MFKGSVSMREAACERDSEWWKMTFGMELESIPGCRFIASVGKFMSRCPRDARWRPHSFSLSGYWFTGRQKVIRKSQEMPPTAMSDRLHVSCVKVRSGPIVTRE